MLATACAIAVGGPGCASGVPAATRPFRIAAADMYPPDSDLETVDARLHSASAVDRWDAFIVEACRHFGILPRWARGVMQAESGGRTTHDGGSITSRAGAIGLMQVMPETYSALRQRLGLGPDPTDPRDNIFAGVAYLREMFDRFGYPGLFAAYNAGPDRYEAYLTGAATLPDETWHYLAAIGSTVAHAVRLQGKRAHSLWAVSGNAGSKASADSTNRTLFFSIGSGAATHARASRRADFGVRNRSLFVQLGTRLAKSPTTKHSAR